MPEPHWHDLILDSALLYDPPSRSHYRMVPSISLSVPFQPISPEGKGAETSNLVKIFNVARANDSTISVRKVKAHVT